MSSPFPADRIQLDEVSPKPLKAMYHLQSSLELDETLANLIRLRASLINGCAFCIDMHWKDARAAGESEERPASLEERELAEVVYEATVINAWNRLMIAARVQPGLYEPGKLQAA
jgi:AhpD family alkylhydroperoxidase